MSVCVGGGEGVSVLLLSLLVRDDDITTQAAEWKSLFRVAIHVKSHYLSSIDPFAVNAINYRPAASVAHFLLPCPHYVGAIVTSSFILISA